MRTMTAKTARLILAVASGWSKLPLKTRYKAKIAAAKWLKNGWTPTTNKLHRPVDWTAVSAALYGMASATRHTRSVWLKVA